MQKNSIENHSIFTIGIIVYAMRKRMGRPGNKVIKDPLNHWNQQILTANQVEVRLSKRLERQSIRLPLQVIKNYISGLRRQNNWHL
jgi:hypothetical protein